MIKKRPNAKTQEVKVSFSIPHEWCDGAVSVVGDFNDWDPLATPLRKRGDVRTAAVVLESGREYRFRYLDAHGRWHDDPEADRMLPNELGGADCVIDLRSVGAPSA